jgi:hypothetical protein
VAALVAALRARPLDGAVHAVAAAA